MKRSFYACGVIAVLALAGCGDDQQSTSRSTLPPGIGDVSVVVRLVHGTLANQDMRRMLAVRDDVYWHELIETERESATEVEFVDGTRLTLGADAKVNLDEFVFGGPPGTDRMVMTVTKGMSRFVTGSMDKAAYEIRAPGAIIGVRGTEFTLVVDPDAGTTLCMVHKGEVELKRPSGGQRVIVQPGEASKASSKGTDELTPAAPSPTEAVKSAETLRAVVDAARGERQAALGSSGAAGQQVARTKDADREGASQLSYDYGRQHAEDYVSRLRKISGGDHRSASPATASEVGSASASINKVSTRSQEVVGGVKASAIGVSRADEAIESENAAHTIVPQERTEPSAETPEAKEQHIDTPTEQPTVNAATPQQAPESPTVAGGGGGVSGCNGSSNCQTSVPIQVERATNIASKTRVRGG